MSKSTVELQDSIVTSDEKEYPALINNLHEIAKAKVEVVDALNKLNNLQADFTEVIIPDFTTVLTISLEFESHFVPS